MTLVRVTVIRDDPFCYVLFTEFIPSAFPLYVLVRLVYGCLLNNYLTVEEGRTPQRCAPMDIRFLPKVMQFFEKCSGVLCHAGYHLEGMARRPRGRLTLTRDPYLSTNDGGSSNER